MRTITVILLVILFCVWQIAFLKKVKSTWKKYIPTAIGGVGVIIGLAICSISYIPYVAKMYSQSTLSENQYFAITVCVLFAPCLVGGLLGVVLEKFFGKRKILYFLPFILSLITYFVASFLGFGMISVKELIWLALFLMSGFLISDEKVWGCLFGMIPGIVFVWMSTNDTGQVINIELPLGLIIIGFYLGCGACIYRKRYLNKR